MDKELNLVEILKNAPKGTKLYSPICGECELDNVNSNDTTYPIACKYNDREGYLVSISFTAEGRYSYYSNGECLLFPSKENRDWSTFKVPNKHKHFEPFQKVLCAYDHDYGYEVWAADFYSHYEEATCQHFLVSGFTVSDSEIIPYEGNEDKLGKPVK